MSEGLASWETSWATSIGEAMAYIGDDSMPVHIEPEGLNLAGRLERCDEFRFWTGKCAYIIVEDVDYGPAVYGVPRDPRFVPDPDLRWPHDGKRLGAIVERWYGDV